MATASVSDFWLINFPFRKGELKKVCHIISISSPLLELMWMFCLILPRYMVATRNLKAGDVIFREKAVVCGPKQGHTPLCLSCYAPVDDTSYRCPSCSFPFCNQQCAQVAQGLLFSPSGSSSNEWTLLTRGSISSCKLFFSSPELSLWIGPDAQRRVSCSKSDHDSSENQRLQRRPRGLWLYFAAALPAAEKVQWRTVPGNTLLLFHWFLLIGSPLLFVVRGQDVKRKILGAHEDKAKVFLVKMAAPGQDRCIQYFSTSITMTQFCVFADGSVTVSLFFQYLSHQLWILKSGEFQLFFKKSAVK